MSASYMVMANISMRPAELSDLDKIVDVHTQARTAYYRAGGLQEADIDTAGGAAHRRGGWAGSIKSGDKRVLCALHTGEVAGIVAMGPPLSSNTEADTATVGELYQIHVLPTHWGQGIGSQLHATFIQYLHEAALPIGQVEAWDRNHRAQAFYFRHGWRPTGHRRQGPDHSNYIRMHLTAVTA
ncbi:GNAT family N-acetyltransferase [Streptomyces platensis]|uniref:GNAT family N-acetyltransferase n=1 Tax=Streptomyces platensis TaxID=58346 RepID=UPI0038634057|nr:GNAT family N-acetyltransferase [Streptomyces platensis]